MRRLTRDLLHQEHGCWSTAVVGDGETLADRLNLAWPDLLIVDGGDFPACCAAALRVVPRQRVVTIGAEPDPGYRTLALGEGAGAWLSRDRIAEDLGHELRRILGCVHCPCSVPVDVSPSDPRR